MLFFEFHYSGAEPTDDVKEIKELKTANEILVRALHQA